MKAFLSHSSKDKHFVQAIAHSLGSALCEYDEYTFDFVLNAQAIRQAFSRCDLFVLFLSANSIRSDFVSEEIRTALDLRTQGQIKKVLIISLDETSYKALPEWMQAINVSARLTTTKTCARRIETELYVLDSLYGKSSDLYQPRDEEVPLRAALSKPLGTRPHRHPRGWSSRNWQKDFSPDGIESSIPAPNANCCISATQQIRGCERVLSTTL
jgi:hypothetical protein